MNKIVEPFKPTKNIWLGKIIRIDSPSGARSSVEQLTTEWNFAYIDKKVDRKQRHLLIRSASEAIRRSNVQLARKHLSTGERKQFKEIVEIYRKWLVAHRLR